MNASVKSRGSTGSYGQRPATGVAGTEGRRSAGGATGGGGGNGYGRDHEDPATEYAITTVNVPDRLDMREVNDRSLDDDRRVDLRGLWTWVKRAVVTAALVAIGWLGWQMAGPLRESLSAESIAARLTAALGTPVTVASTGFSLTPSPRLTATQIDAKSFAVSEVSLHLNWSDMWRAIRTGSPTWGEATVAPLSLTAEQLFALIHALPRLGPGLPPSISTIRLEAIELAGESVLPGRFEAVARRDSAGQFGQVEFVGLGGDATMRLRLQPAEAGITAFQLDASGWQPEFGPRTKWSEVVASGRILTEPLGFEVTQYTAAGFFGSVEGQVNATHDQSWVVAGTAKGNSFDVEAILKHLRGKGSPPAAAAQGAKAVAAPIAPEGQLPMSGTIAFNSILVGGGPTLQAALDQTLLSGPAEIRFATLNGVNLGFAATRPAAGSGTSGGSTRFTELTSNVLAGSTGVRFDDILGKAGAMSTHGEVTVAPDLKLDGTLRVDLGTTRVQAPLNLKVRGTALAPTFGS